MIDEDGVPFDPARYDDGDTCTHGFRRGDMTFCPYCKDSVDKYDDQGRYLEPW